jgi:hypothetical protein
MRNILTSPIWNNRSQDCNQPLHNFVLPIKVRIHACLAQREGNEYSPWDIFTRIKIMERHRGMACNMLVISCTSITGIAFFQIEK